MPPEENRIEDAFNDSLEKSITAPEPEVQAPVISEGALTTVKTVGNIFDVALLASFGYYIVSGKPAPRGLLIAGAAAVGFRIVKNLKILPQNVVEIAEQTGM